jgi:hypothetical protein
MADGPLTAKMARLLSQWLAGHEYDVFCGHRGEEIFPVEGLGHIVSWFGPEYNRDSRLALLDIAVISDTKALALVEIEESSDEPKTLIGDVFATLLGDHISYRGQDLEVGAFTTLIVLGRNNSGHSDSAALLEQHGNSFLSTRSSGNASIGRVVVDTFRDEGELEAKLKEQIERALFH